MQLAALPIFFPWPHSLFSWVFCSHKRRFGSSSAKSFVFSQRGLLQKFRGFSGTQNFRQSTWAFYVIIQLVGVQKASEIGRNSSRDFALIET